MRKDNQENKMSRINMVDTIKNSPEYKRLINSPTYQKRRRHFMEVLCNIEGLNEKLMQIYSHMIEK